MSYQGLTSCARPGSQKTVDAAYPKREPELSIFSRIFFRVIALFGLSVLWLSLVRLETYLWNFQQFSHQSMDRMALAAMQGLRFDLAASTWLILPCFLILLIPSAGVSEAFLSRLLFGTFFVFEIPFLTLNLVDVEFVNFVGRRMTADVFFLLQEAQGKMGGFLVAFAGLFAIATVTIFTQVGLAWKLAHWDPKLKPWMPVGKSARLVFAVLTILFVIIFGRGGLQKKPITFADANVFAEPVLNNLVLNTSFNILKNLGQPQLPRAHFFADRKELEGFLNGKATGPSLLEGLRTKEPQNVVVLILESFDRSYMGTANGPESWTPFLDDLEKRSLSFKNAYANGRRSIEGVAAILGGIPAMMNEPFITSPFMANRFVGLGTLLRTKGYDSSFFHGGNNGTMHFDSFLKSAGVDQYFGANEYPNAADNDGVWGIYDGPFFHWFAGKIDTFHQPFLTSVFSLSSHQPYLIPPDVAQKYHEGSLPILKTIHYTDDVLRDFFAAAEKQPWYQNTLFVITADHAFKSVGASPESELQHFRIPLIFFHPNFSWPSTIDRDQVVQQIDILPSILDFLDVPERKGIALARSVFVPGEKSVTLFEDGNYTLVTKDFYLSQPRGSPPQMYRIEDLEKQTSLEQPLDEKAKLESRLKASIQFFSEGMWDNRLY